MVQTSDIRSDLFPDLLCLVKEDPSKSYTITLTDDELRNDVIERLYGPFGDNNNSPVGSPQPLMRSQDTTYKKRLDAINELKQQIAERQARNEALGKTLLAAAKGSIEVQQKPSSSTSRINEEAESSSQAAAKLAPVILIEDSDDDSDMSIDSGDNMSVHSDDSNHSEASGHSSSQDTFYSATDQTSTDELLQEEDVNSIFLLNEEHDLIQATIASLTDQLKDLQTSSKEVQLKILGIKVRMSMNKNRNELKNKPTTPEAIPALGSKRDFSSASNEDDIPTQPAAHRKSRRTFNYGPPDMMNYGYNATSPFYQQIPPQPMHGFIPPLPNYLPPQQILPPPPPPAGLPPSSPPPPPPPSYVSPVPPPPPAVPYVNTYPAQQPQVPQPRRTSIKSPTAAATFTHNIGGSLNVPKPRPPIRNEESDIEPMKDAALIDSIFKEIEQLISLRIFNDITDRPIVEERPLPRPVRLITVDKYTMPMNMIILNENKGSFTWQQPTKRFTLPAGRPIETEMADSWYESPLFIMLRKKGTSQPLNTVMIPAIQSLLDSVPPTDDLSTVKIGSVYFVSLEKTLRVARGLSFQDPKNEFFAALKLELSFYVNGNTKLFQDDYQESVAQIPLSVDLEWQRIRAEVTFSNQLPLILDLLHRISLTHTSFDSKESLTVSSMTAEVLIRLLRLNGLEQVLRLMTNKEIDIDTEKAEVFDMDDTPGLYLQEQDKYSVWMLILYYYITKTLPEGVCSTWMNSLVKDGAPTKNMSLFMVEWNPADLLEKPLDRSTLFGATNILLSMLRHFRNKACNDIGRKPLLVGVLRTLSNFLSYTPSYKNAGTLLLMRKTTNIIEQVPEIQEIIAELEIKVSSPDTKIVENIYGARKLMSQSNLYSLTYHVGRAYYEKKPFSKSHLFVLANILLYPLLENNTQPIQVELMKQLTTASPDSLADDRLVILLQKIRQKYLTALGMDSLLAANATQPQLSNNQKISLRKVTFAWINLLLLTVICKFMYPETSPIREELQKINKSIFEEAMRKVESEDGKLTVFKYAKQLL